MLIKKLSFFIKVKNFIKLGKKWEKGKKREYRSFLFTIYDFLFTIFFSGPSW